MILRSVADIAGTERDVVTENWASRRLLLRQDGMGFSFHETTIFAGTETSIWYKNHLEAVFCISGHGEVETLRDKTIHPVGPGDMYALDCHDQHLLRAHSEMRLLCVFNPPLTGREVHDEEGVYPLNDRAAAAASPTSSGA